MRQAGETGNSLKMVFRNHPENERIVRTTAAVFVSILDPTLEEISDFKTAVSEAVTNAIIHAYPKTGGDIEAYFILERARTVVYDRVSQTENLMEIFLFLFFFFFSQVSPFVSFHERRCVQGQNSQTVLKRGANFKNKHFLSIHFYLKYFFPRDPLEIKEPYEEKYLKFGITNR